MANLFEVQDLHESGNASRVDRDLGVIRRVKLLGWTSANGREYDPKGVDPAMYEGRVVNIDHTRPGQTGSAHDRFGRVVNVTKDAGGLYGDLEYLKSHPMAGPVSEAAERMPGVFGMSHTAKGRTRRGPKGVVVEAVESVQSVDLVGDPATVSGFFEGKHMAKLTVAEIAKSIKAKRPGYSRALTEMAEAGIMSPGATMDPPAPEPDGDESVDHEQALLDAAKAVLDDDALDTKAKLAKIKDILKIVDGGKGEPPPDDTAADSGDGSDAEESKKRKKGDANLREELARLKARDLLRSAADDAGVKIPRTLLTSVKLDLTESEAKALVAELKGTAPSRQAPRSATPKATTPASKSDDGTVQESKVPNDPKAVGKWLNGR